LREGYDMSQVDTFLGRVEVTLTTVLQENTQLRARLVACDYATQYTQLVGHSAADIVAGAREGADRTIATARREILAILAQTWHRADALECGAREQAFAGQREAHVPCHQDVQRHVEDLHVFIADYSHLLRRSLRTQVGQLEGLLDELVTPHSGSATPAPSVMPMTAHHPADDYPASAHSAADRPPVPTQPMPQLAGPQVRTPLEGPCADEH
jgi:hypothetical protein